MNATAAEALALWRSTQDVLNIVCSELEQARALNRELAAALHSLDHPCPCGCGNRTIHRDQWESMKALLAAHPELTR